MSGIWDKHISVLLKELSENIYINPKKQNIIVDSTLWLWWHFIEIAKKLNCWDIIIWFELDKKNLELAKSRIEEELEEIGVKRKVIKEKKEQDKKKINIMFINSNFCNINEELNKAEIEEITWIYYDLWLSSLHLDEEERGFSFMKNWPLDMRLDKNSKKTAKDIVNNYSVKDLKEIFYKYWEEPRSSKIAQDIFKKRKEKKFETTKDLADIINWPIKVKTRIFQAIRIEVNNELGSLKKSLDDSIKLLDIGWVIFVISFHSLEDRIVKQVFKRETKDCICSDIICSCNHKKSLTILNKKPLLPSFSEIKKNPRSRSAKARIWIKT